MKTLVKKAIRDEKGAALALALVLLVVGGLILTPLLGLMTTGLMAGQVYENKTAELYAADAGIEDALWKIQHGIEIPAGGYNLTVNDKYVWVTMDPIDTEQFVSDLLGVDPKNWVASDWVIIGRIPQPGEAEITISWNGSGNGFLTDVGIWLDGTCSYVEGQTIPDGDIRAQYPSHTFEQKAYKGGTAFVWTWENQTTRPDSRDTPTTTLTFDFTPEYRPGFSIAFTMMGRQNVGLSIHGEIEGGTITATATSYIDTATADVGSQTTVVARAFASCLGLGEIEVVSWNIV